MKNCLRKILAAVTALLLLAGGAVAQSRIGTVDLDKVYDNYWRQKQALGALKELVADLRKEADAMREIYKKSAATYQKLRDEASDPAVSTEERDKRKKSAEDKLKELKESEDTIKRYEIQAQTRISEQRSRVRDKLIEEIRAAVNAKAKAGGYTLVIDTSAKSGNSTLELISLTINRQDPTEEYSKTTPVVVYSSPETDLTASVIEQLNAGAPVDALKPAEKKDEPKSGSKDEKKK